MSERFDGVQAKLKAKNPHSVHIHCCNHAIDLVVEEAAKEVRIVTDSLGFIKSVSIVVAQSPKRISRVISIIVWNGSNSHKLTCTKSNKVVCSCCYSVKAAEVLSVFVRMLGDTKTTPVFEWR